MSGELGSVDAPAASGAAPAPAPSEGLELENRRLREANEELRRANAALARDAMARQDSGAASAIHRATAAERTLLRSQGWDEWPKPLRLLVGVALRLRRLRERIRA